VCLADSPRVLCSLHVHHVRAHLRFRSGFVLGFCCSWFADGPSFSSGRSGSRADGPSFSSGRSGSRADGLPGLRRRSVFLGSFLVVLLALTDCLRLLAGLFVWSLRTVRPSWPDSPPVPDSFAHWFDSSLLSFMLLRVLQGIVPKT
jgi:hypothetical protein